MTNLRSKIDYTRYHHCAVTLSGAIYVMGGIVGRSADHVEQGSGQKISNSVIRIRPLEEKWTEMQSMLEDRSTFSCAVWNGWIWVHGSNFYSRSDSANFFGPDCTNFGPVGM